VFYTDLNKVVIGRQAPADDDLIYVNQKLSLPFHPQLWYTEKVSGCCAVGSAPGLGVPCRYPGQVMAKRRKALRRLRLWDFPRLQKAAQKWL
jgi:hypothetical protein